MELNLFKNFVSLTDEALSEKDVDRLIRLLTERNDTLDLEGKDGPGLGADELQEYLNKETAVLSRLIEEEKKVLTEMDALSKSRKAARRYRPKFPFPSMPVFFDKKA